jgi:outer membrane biogenesis lipoprotein LolB
MVMRRKVEKQSSRLAVLLYLSCSSTMSLDRAPRRNQAAWQPSSKHLSHISHRNGQKWRPPQSLIVIETVR